MTYFPVVSDCSSLLGWAVIQIILLSSRKSCTSKTAEASKPVIQLQYVINLDNSSRSNLEEIGKFCLHFMNYALCKLKFYNLLNDTFTIIKA